MRELGRILYKKRGSVILSFSMNASREMGQRERVRGSWNKGSRDRRREPEIVSL